MGFVPGRHYDGRDGFIGPGRGLLDSGAGHISHTVAISMISFIWEARPPDFVHPRGRVAVNYRKGFAGGDEHASRATERAHHGAPWIYGTIGGGWYSIDPDDDITDQLGDVGDFSNAALHLGGGVSIPVSEKWNFIGDLRYVFLNYDIENIPDLDTDADFYMITGGLQYEVF
jgi:hypothetical protein